MGRSPVIPKLLGVSTMPVPKCPFQMRLTMTRMAMGCFRMSSASSRRPLPLVNGCGIAGREHAQEMTRHFRPEVFGVAANGERQIHRLGGVLHAVKERIGGLEFLARFLDIGADGGHLRLRFGAGAAFEPPSAEEQHDRACRRVRPWPSWRPGRRNRGSSRWKTSVQKLFSSSGMFFRRRPQLGQKSSLVMNSLGLLARFFFLVPSSDLAVMISFSSLSSLRASMTLTTFSWNSSASFLTSALAPAAAPPPPLRPPMPPTGAGGVAAAVAGSGLGSLAVGGAGADAGALAGVAGGAVEGVGAPALGPGPPPTPPRPPRPPRPPPVADAARVRFIMACQASLYLYLSVGFSMYLIHRSSSS